MEQLLYLCTCLLLLLFSDTGFGMTNNGNRQKRYCNDYYIHRIIVQDISETNADLEELVKIQISQVSQLVQPQERKFDELISSLSFLSSKASLLFGKIETVGYGLTMVSKALPGSEGGANESSTQSTPPGSTTPWLSQTTLTGSQGFESSTVWTPQSNATLQAPQSTVSGNPEQTSTPHSNETEGSGYAKRQKRATHAHITEDIQDLRDNMARLFQEQMKKIAEIVKAPQDVKFDQLTTSVATLTNNLTSLFEIVGSVERQLSVISNALDIDHITHIPPGQESTSPVPMNLPSMPPKILFQSSQRKIYFKEGDTVELPCVAYAYPLPSYRWTRDGADFNTDNNRTETRPDSGTLIIHNPDEGIYQCYAENFVAVSMSDKFALVKAYLESLHNNYVSTIHGIPGWPRRLYCPKVNSQPPVIKTWAIRQVNGSLIPVEESTKVSINPEGNLNFANVLPEDEGVYVCLASNPFLGTVTESATRLKLYSRAPELRSPNILSSTARDVIGLEGESITLFCIFGGNPVPNITWSRGGWYVSRAIRQKWGQELVFQNLRTYDEGSYTCVGSNLVTGEEASYEIQLKVEAKPSFSWSYGHRDREITIGEKGADRIRIVCNANGTPKPTFTWYINGVEIHESYVATTIDYEIPPRDPGFLILKNLTVNNQMTVQCNATNKHGYVYATTALYIREPTSPDPMSNISPASCRDLLGPNCANVTNEGHCNNEKAALFCLDSCAKCPLQIETSTVQ